jgi:hypothetical protein
MNLRPLTADEIQAIDRFVAVANRYCSTLEGAPALSGPQLVRRSAELLPELYRAALDLPDIEPATSGDDHARRGAAKEDAHVVHASLPHGIAAYSMYWHSVDPFTGPPDEPVASDLRNDLVKIYEDVRTGLRAWPAASTNERADIAWGWRFHFIHHWGRHVTSALTAIHALLFDRFIEFPQDSAE